MALFPIPKPEGNPDVDMNKLVTEVDDIVKKLSPYLAGIAASVEAIATVAAPEAAAAVAVASKIVSGVLQAEPAAMALYKQITSGVPATAEQLRKYEEDYEDAYAQLQHDIKAKLAAMPPSGT